MKRVVVSPLAAADEAEVLTYLSAQAGLRVAQTYRARFRDVYRLLAQQPDMGALRPALGAGVRIAIVEPYLVIYLHERDAVSVLRILHGRRRITAATLRPAR